MHHFPIIFPALPSVRLAGKRLAPLFGYLCPFSLCRTRRDHPNTGINPIFHKFCLRSILCFRRIPILIRTPTATTTNAMYVSDCFAQTVSAASMSRVDDFITHKCGANILPAHTSPLPTFSSIYRRLHSRTPPHIKAHTVIRKGTQINNSPPTGYDLDSTKTMRTELRIFDEYGSSRTLGRGVVK